MDLIETITEYIRENRHKFDGICNPDQECACRIDGAGLFPCDVPDVAECLLGHAVKCESGEHDFRVYPGPRPKDMTTFEEAKDENPSE